MNDTKILRKSMLELRRKLTESEVEEKSKEIYKKLIEIKEIKTSKKVMCYMSFDNEVDTKDFINDVLKLKKEIVLPVIRENNITPFCVDSLSNTKEGAFCIMEPCIMEPCIMEPNQKICKECCLEEIDVVIVPAVVFGKNGERIGRGCGYYDRFLKTLRDIRKENVKFIGIGYDFQVVDGLYQNEYDVPVDFVVTEKRFIKRVL